MGAGRSRSRSSRLTEFISARQPASDCLLARSPQAHLPVALYTGNEKQFPTPLRKAIRDVFGERGVIQRCQIHKRRNVLGHLPKKAHGNVSRLLAEAYSGDNVALSRKRLKSLVSWLEGEGHDGAASSLREGLEETLTVVALKLSDTLRRSLSSTNAIENTLGTVRRVTRNVKRWRGGDMAKRWTAIGQDEATAGVAD